MIRDIGPIYQACLGTLLTWGFTACGAAVVILFKGTQQKLLDSSLGFAAGVMLAASYWSLLDPAIEMAEQSQIYGKHGEYSFAPVAFGFFLGALFVYGTDVLISSIDIKTPYQMMVAMNTNNPKKTVEKCSPIKNSEQGKSWGSDEATDSLSDVISHPSVISRRKNAGNSQSEYDNQWRLMGSGDQDTERIKYKEGQWKRILLLIVAVTIHNIPEGLAVGVGFGAIGNSASATFESARRSAIKFENQCKTAMTGSAYCWNIGKGDGRERKFPTADILSSLILMN